MTVGQRIAQKRKELGLSQEALGEQMGVSRQAIYKWESGAALPEIEKLIALSKIFAVPVGWLLGVEEDTPESGDTQDGSGELTETQLKMVEEIVRRYQESLPAPQPRKKWPWVLAVIVLVLVFARLFSLLGRLQQDYDRMQTSVEYIDRNVDNQINSITYRVENILERMNSFTVEHGAEIAGADLAANTVTFDLHAVPKTYTEGMTAIFQADYGDGIVETEPLAGSSEGYTAALTCPLTDEIVLSVVFVTGDKREMQNIQTYNELYSESFPIHYISTGPLFWDVENDALIAGRDFSVHPSSYGASDGMPRAEAVEMRLGLFRDYTLEYWLEPLAEKPDTFVGEGWDDHLFFRNPKEHPLDRSSTYCLALVVTDNYGRDIVCPEIPIMYEPGESGEGKEAEGDWTWTNDSSLRSSDPADWNY